MCKSYILEQKKQAKWREIQNRHTNLQILAKVLAGNTNTDGTVALEPVNHNLKVEHSSLGVDRVVRGH